MAQQKEETTERRLDRIALTPPRMTVVADHALGHGECDDDCFDLTYKLGPVFDILRYPKTRTPMAIAIYGDWGSGKTSAMEWLHGLVERWNKDKVYKGADKVCVKPVWFYPWKYHTKEDVWRGLIAEVIIESIKIKGASRSEIVNAAKQFGLFLGRGFIHIMAGLTLKAKAKAPGTELGVDADLAGLKDILEDYRDTTHPEGAYLNDFESGLRDWINRTLNKNERMVIFIDDLDRCMPDIALEVLEALKLYLNIPRLIFVVGVDRKVINDLVTKYYEKLGVKEEQSRNYLAKMFQVEVEVSPHEHQVEEFLDMQLKDIQYWQDELTNDERDMFRRMILRFAGRNPREIKRQVNSALMAASGATMVSRDDARYTFSQGLQVFFVRKVLEQAGYSRTRLVGSKLGDDFFHAWSEVVLTDPIDPAPRSLQVPEEFIDQQRESDRTRLSVDPEVGVGTETEVIHPSSFADARYESLLNERRFADLLNLLRDPDLGDLMTVQYPASTELISTVMGSGKDYEIVMEAVARSLGKKPQDVTEQDYAQVTQLEFGECALTDLQPIRNLISLQSLDLRGTQVAHLAPIRNLSMLSELHLDGTDVASLDPIRNLSRLHTLSLGDTKVTNLEPLRNLRRLRALDLAGASVEDLMPIRDLTDLEELHLEYTKVTDLTPLENLRALWYLDLDGTKVADLAPLNKLTGLLKLNPSGTQAEELTPLSNLIALETLFLNRTPVTDLTPVGTLSSLRHLFMNQTKVADLGPVVTVPNLMLLSMDGTVATDFTPLGNLTSLQCLSMNRTQVEDLAPLRALSKLRMLRLSKTKVSDLEPLKELTALENLDITGTPVRDMRPLQTLPVLMSLHVSGSRPVLTQANYLKEHMSGLSVTTSRLRWPESREDEEGFW